MTYQLDNTGRHIHATADHVIGHRNQLGRRRLSSVNRKDTGMGGRLAFDDVYQRLFMNDSAFAGPPGNRILVFDADPDRLEDYPPASYVLGQPDFTTRIPGSGRKKFGSGEMAIDNENQRLFALDTTNDRVLVFDIHPDRINNFPDAKFVIGQPDFDSRTRGVSRNQLGLRTQFGGRPNGIALDPVRQHLYVSDSGNNRILVFDVRPDRLRNGPEAIAVIGQPDFLSNDPQVAGAGVPPEQRSGLKKVTPGGLGFDSRYKRLFVSQPEENRILVFDLSELKETQNPDAIAVIGQPDFTTLEPAVARNRISWPKSPVVDSKKQMLYVSEGFEGGNRVVTFDIDPRRLTDGPDAVDVIGHLDDRGRIDFDRRNANDRINGRFGAYVRALSLDPIDHRLFAADEYNNRVLVYQLDADNRLLDREARWVFGQKDLYSAESSRTAVTMRIPLAVAYDSVDKRLYVGDSWNDRILIFDADPRHLRPGGGHSAIVVLGQADFKSQDPRTTRNRMDFAVTRGRGIASSIIPVGIAIDARGRRAFVSDGGNNRILVFNIAKDQLHSGADALAVLGQEDFTSKRISLTARGMNSPGHLTYDADHDRLFAVDSLHHRVLVFDVAPGQLHNGMAAGRVIGQPDFTTTLPPQRLRRYAGAPTERNIPFPNGIVYDRKKQQLYVGDRGNDRVMIFDAAPERLQNFPKAVAVLGQRDATSHSTQVESDPSGMDQLYDPRGMAFDSENQLLYVSDSHFARIMLYNFPAHSRRVRARPNGVVSFKSLDSYTVLNPWQPHRGFGLIKADSNARSTYMITRTKLETEVLTERQSRQLISQSAAPAPEAATNTLLFVEGRHGAVTTMLLVNPGPRPSTIRFELRGGDGRVTTASKTVGAGASLTTTLLELMGGNPETGALHVSSELPVAVAAWYEVQNRHGERLSIILPAVRGGPRTDGVLPNIVSGSGYQTDLVLLNPAKETLRGRLVLFDEDGRQVVSAPYQVEPRGSFLYHAPDSGLLPSSRYAVAQPAAGGAPAMASLITRADEGLITETSVESFRMQTHARVPLNTLPDLIRHRRHIDLRLIIANPGRVGATIRFLLRDLQGRQVDRYEQTILPGLQRDFSLADLFDRTQFAGSVTLVSDVAVGVVAQLATVNLRGEEILTALPVLSGNSSAPVIYPYLDGGGVSTELIVSAGEQAPIQSRLDMFSADGKEMKAILR